MIAAHEQYLGEKNARELSHGLLQHIILAEAE
jgi:hypothetical protein